MSIDKNMDVQYQGCMLYTSVILAPLRPGQTLATFQSNILQHCCMMLRHVLNGPAKRTQHFHHFQRNMSMFMCPSPRRATKWTYCACSSATMLRERGQTSTTKMLRRTFVDPTSSNMLQHITTGLPNVGNMLSPTLLHDDEMVYEMNHI